jgi:hypothetical protein
MPQQTDIIDAAFKRLELLLTEAEQFADTLFTETDTRIKIIDTMLIEVLGCPPKQPTNPASETICAA